MADGERAIRERERAEEYIARLQSAIPLPIIEVPLLAQRDLDVRALTQIGAGLEWNS